MYSPLTIAGSFLQKSREWSRPLTPMALTKLVYLAHGWHLGLTGQPLTGERPQAWKYGPVYRSLYHALKPYGADDIPGFEHLDYTEVPVGDGYVSQLIAEVWDRYSELSAIQLSSLTHQKDSPWYKTWHEHGGKVTKGTQIPDALIADHYRQKIESATGN